MKIPDPAKANEFFRNKMSFTTGPVEVDYFRKQGDDFNIIDVRSAEDFEDEHIPGSINLPEEKWGTFQGLSKDKLNIITCYSVVCHLAAKAAVKFSAAGYPVMELDGGFDGWKEHDLPVEGKGAQVPVVGQPAA